MIAITKCLLLKVMGSKGSIMLWVGKIQDGLLCDEATPITTPLHVASQSRTASLGKFGCFDRSA